MTKLAFCGLGRMGAPMATRLVRAGHRVTVWNRTASRTEPLRLAGAAVASTPAESAAGAGAAITMLGTPEALEEVVFGPDGLGEGLAPAATLIEMSTVGPDAVHGVASRLPAGVRMIDAPVVGSAAEAAAGTLKIFAGGPAGDVARWEPVLSAMGTVTRVGGLGTGAAMKLLVNSTLVTVMNALAEALALGDALGLDPGVVLDVLEGSRVGGTVSAKRSRIESGRFPASFRLTLARKDADLVVEAAGRHGLALPVAEAGAARFAQAETAGLGDLDYAALTAFVRNRPAGE